MGLFEIIFGKNGKSSRASYVDESHLEKVLDRHTHPKTGEVKGIVSIKDVNNPANKVDIRTNPNDDARGGS